MAFPWGLLVFVIGIVYGFVTPGRQSKTRLFKQGLLWGLIVAIVLAVIGAVAHASPLGIEAGFVGIVLSALVLTLLFIVGVWLGDLLEGRRGTRGLGRV